MRKLIISLLIILMFGLSLNKNNPMKKRVPTYRNNEAQVIPLNVRVRCPYPCGGGYTNEVSFMKLSRETITKHKKNNEYEII